MESNRSEKNFGAIPQNLYADADQKEGRELHDYSHPGSPDRAAQAIGESVTKINTERQQGGADNRRRNIEKIESSILRRVGAQGDGYRNRARPDRQRQRQRIECIAERNAWLNILPGIFRVAVAALFQQRPSGGNNDQSASHLYDWDGNSKEPENMRPNEIRTHQEEEAVHCDAPRQRTARGRQILPRHRQEDRAASERINDGK